MGGSGRCWRAGSNPPSRGHAGTLLHQKPQDVGGGQGGECRRHRGNDGNAVTPPSTVVQPCSRPLLKANRTGRRTNATAPGKLQACRALEVAIGYTFGAWLSSTVKLRVRAPIRCCLVPRPRPARHWHVLGPAHEQHQGSSRQSYPLTVEGNPKEEGGYRPLRQVPPPQFAPIVEHRSFAVHGRQCRDAADDSGSRGSAACE